MDAARTFEDLGVNAIVGVELMERFGLTTWDLEDPQKFARLHSVIDYLKGFSEDTQRFLISKAAAKVNEDRLNIMFEYVHLLKQKDSFEHERETLTKEQSALEGNPMLYMEMGDKVRTVDESLGRLKEEISIYEK